MGQTSRPDGDKRLGLALVASVLGMGVDSGRGHGLLIIRAFILSVIMHHLFDKHLVSP